MLRETGGWACAIGRPRSVCASAEGLVSPVWHQLERQGRNIPVVIKSNGWGQDISRDHTEESVLVSP